MESTALADLIERHRDALVTAWEQDVRRLPSARDLHALALRDLIPGLLDEIALSLRRSRTETTPDEINAAAEHGHHRLTLGFDLREVAQEYKALRRCISELAERHGMPLQGQTARHIHGVLDDAVTIAISAYIENRDVSEAKQREDRMRFLVHDLRSPLAAIHQAIAVVEQASGNALAETSRAMLAAVRRNIRHLQAMTIKLLQTERNRATGPVRAVTRWSVSLASLATDAIDALQALADHANVTLRNEISPTQTVTVDPELIERVFQNLLTNAIEHAPNTTVVIGAHAVDDGVEVRIVDCGKGVPDELKQKVFDSFFTTRVDGTGLGLAIAKQFVEAHGGSLHIDDNPQGGTVLRFVIPQGS